MRRGLAPIVAVILLN
ncbi:MULTISPECIES: archaellin/type IV pilin N-terminal domain-containing protein [Psychrobacter]